MSDIIEYDPNIVNIKRDDTGLKVLPELPITIRDAILSDIPFIDGLQKIHKRGVGWMPTGQLEGHINKGHVIIAESFVGGGETGGTPVPPDKIGYCIGGDKYFKREDVGIIYQMNITPGKQRGLVGATLLKHMFEPSAYGVRLFCCWCA